MKMYGEIVFTRCYPIRLSMWKINFIQKITVTLKKRKEKMKKRVSIISVLMFLS